MTKHEATPQDVQRVDVLIGGAGFAGLALAIALRQGLGRVVRGRGRRSGARPSRRRRARLGDRGGGAAAVRDDRRLGRGRGRRAADPRHGGHRLPAAGRGAADVPHLRRRGRAGRAVRPHDRERRRCSPRWSSKAKADGRRAARRRGRGFRQPARDRIDVELAGRRDDCRRGCWSPPTARARRSASAAGIASHRLELRPVRHRHHRRARARSSRPRRGAFPAGRAVRDPAAARAGRSSIVWTEEKREAERIVALPDDEFHAELERRFGLHARRDRSGRPAPRLSARACRWRARSSPSASRWSATPRM